MAGARAFSAQSTSVLFLCCYSTHVSGSIYFESLFPPTTKATQGGPTTEAEVSSAIRYLYLRREPVGAPCTTCRWRLGCRLAMRCTTEGHNLVNFDSNLLDRPCCGNRDLDGPKFAFRGGCIWPGLAWPRHMAMLVYLRFRSGVPSNSIDCHGEKDERSISHSTYSSLSKTNYLTDGKHSYTSN